MKAALIFIAERIFYPEAKKGKTTDFMLPLSPSA
jgi:hypothetical protein